MSSKKIGSMSVTFSDTLSYDSMASLTEWAMDVCRDKKAQAQKKASKVIRECLKPGAVVMFDDLASGVSYRRSRKAVVRKRSGNFVYYENLNRKGEVVKRYQKERVTKNGRRRTVTRRYIPYFQLEAPGANYIDMITSIRVKGELVYRRCSFLRKEGATRLLQRRYNHHTAY